MEAVETGLFTVGVFQDVEWASRGLDALKRAGFPLESLSVIARDSAPASTLLESALEVSAEKLDVRGIGDVLAKGPIVPALQGSDAGLRSLGLGGTMRRVGFQAHDGFIFETLTARGGILVAIRSAPRAADALAILHAYGGGNAAIGAWTGRV